jgi:cyclopropane-fatty-acyl-phospholipid synthase
MSKALLNRFLARSVRQGQLGVVFADGSASTFGNPAPGFPEIVLRFTDALAACRT